MVLTEIALVDSEEIAAGTRAFRFTKPAGFGFVPGQFVNLTLIDPREIDEAGTLRSFSIASAPHERELDIVARRLPALRVVHCMCEPEQAAPPWSGETGFITEALLARHVRDLALPTWYVAGPPAMASALRDALANLGVADSVVRVESFAGY